MYLWAQLLMALHELHSLCLPWALALVTTGFQLCPLRKSGVRKWGCISLLSQLCLHFGPPEVGLAEASLPGVAGSERLSKLSAACKELSMPFLLLRLTVSFLQSG